MAKKTHKKKSKRRDNKNKSNVESKDRQQGWKGTSSFIDDASSASFWSIADECAHYAALGCHIASIARYFVPPKNNKHRSGNNKSKSASNSNSTPYISALHASSLECKEDMYKCAMQHHPWLLGIEHFDPSEYNPSDLLNFPEVTMNDALFDDEDDYHDDGDRTMTLTLTNITQDTIKVYIVSVYDVDLCDAAGNVLKSGKASKTTVDSAAAGDDDGCRATTTERKCTTFIVLCPPQTYVHLCSLASNQQLLGSSSSGEKVPITSWSQIEIETDIQPWSYHPNIDDEHHYMIHFPFAPGGNALDSAKCISTAAKQYKCTQSEYGQLTHFSCGNYHAIDFACPIGTPLHSAVNGTVVKIRNGLGRRRCNELSSSDTNHEVEVSGIAARNMLHWNSIVVQADVKARVVTNDTSAMDERSPTKKEDVLYVEYVHIQSNSCVVEVGDVVKKGQLLCFSGSMGFCPEPHLHLAAYHDLDDSVTVRVRFECDDQNGIDDSAKAQLSANKGDGLEEGRTVGGGAETAVENPRNEEEDKAKREIVVSAFLPRAGGWYNRGGLVRMTSEC
jgi:hypothetical protein